ncbi:tRNA dihydrouridine synthase [Litoribacillus peritrichatus]|uniref:tRNA-dihydrouridine(16) synthase n=1 Tax=Litoribacillus peritrichatus TaxID=718191 RepID=A0ABP7N9Q2_9GAMM
MKILLAPMEGVLDAPLREILTRLGRYDLCVSEFIRITDQLLPPKVFYRLCPELYKGGVTDAGTPVRVQLLGNNPETLASSALKAVNMGSPGIDLNFGCPAKTVNKNKGGAILLKEPESIFKVIEAVRQAVPDDIPVTAKMRLGFDHDDNALAIAKGIQEAGANELVIHARTKVQGYKPPAHWHLLAEIKQALSIPLIANGEVWSLEDYKTCREASLCDDVMIGRGAIASPFLIEQIRAYQKNEEAPARSWDKDIKPLLLTYYLSCEPDGTHKHDAYLLGRVKQWLHMLSWQHPEAKEAFSAVKRLKNKSEIFNALELQH